MLHINRNSSSFARGFDIGYHGLPYPHSHGYDASELDAGYRAGVAEWKQIGGKELETMRQIEWIATFEVHMNSLTTATSVEVRELNVTLYAPSEEEARRLAETHHKPDQMMFGRSFLKRVRRADEKPDNAPEDVSELRKRLLDAHKERFRIDYRVLVVAVKTPTGYIETIANHNWEQINEKLEYYKDTYDDNMRLKHNSKIEIVDFMLV